MFSENVALFGR